MSDDIATLKDSTIDAAAAPGQTLLNLHGDGGDDATQDESGRELAQEREQWEHWWCVTRPHKNATYGNTEYLISRLGGDDVVGCESRCLAVAKKVRDELGRDLDEGEVVLYTGSGTKHAMIDIRPNGDLTISNVDGANSITALWDASAGNVDFTTAGKFRIGAAGADSPIARYSALDTLYTTAITGIKAAFDSHGHVYLNAVGAPTLTSVPSLGGIPVVPPGVDIDFPAWDAGAASSSGRCD